MQEYRAVRGSYERDWSIQKRTWFGWRTIHSAYMEMDEAQKLLDSTAKNESSMMLLYPRAE